MPAACRSLALRAEDDEVTHAGPAAPDRAEVEDYIRAVFADRHGARVPGFAPNLVAVRREGRLVAAAGWRAAGEGPLFLEQYLDAPIESAMHRLAEPPPVRSRIVEVGHLAADRAGGSVRIISALARELDARGYEWVVFTATRELVAIFAKLGLPLLALAEADPARLGHGAAAWGRYYDARPIVVAGRIRHALERLGKR